MQGTRWRQVVLVGAVLAVGSYLADLLADPLTGSAATTARVLAIVGAALAAAGCYQHWGAVEHRAPLTHVIGAAGLLGGALVASSAFSAPEGAAFFSGVTALLGSLALVVALVAGWLPAAPGTAGKGRRG